MKQYIILFIIFCLTIFTHCEPIAIDADIPDVSKKICINGYFTNDSTWLVRVTSGKHILDNNDKNFDENNFVPLTNATVSILEDGNTLTQLNHFVNGWIGKEGFYKSSKEKHLLPKPGKNYQIKVSCPGYPDVVGSCLLPKSIPIIKVEKITAVPDERGLISVYIYFNDPPDEENFYEVWSIQRNSEEYPPGNLRIIDFLNIAYTEDQLFYSSTQSSDFLDNSTKSFPVLFSDKGMNGNLIKIRATVFYLPSFSEELKREYYISLQSLSKEYYQYKKTFQLQLETQGDPFAQPALIHTNIQNGFGIFAGYSRSISQY